MRLPESLQDPDDRRALTALRRYFGTGPDAQPSRFIESRFDEWDSTGTRRADANRFTADDLTAVTFLSVSVPAAAAILLLDGRAARFAELLDALGGDRDLVGEVEPWDDN